MSSNSAEYRERNKEKLDAARKRWRERNRDKLRASGREYVRTHREQCCRRMRAWLARNPKERALRRSQYRALVLNRKHSEHDLTIEAALKQRALELSQQTGVIHHVDHIIPLSLGGWHHHANMQVLPAHINVQKSNNPLWEFGGYLCWKDVPQHLWPETLRKIYIKKFYFDIYGQ